MCCLRPFTIWFQLDTPTTPCAFLSEIWNYSCSLPPPLLWQTPTEPCVSLHAFMHIHMCKHTCTHINAHRHTCTPMYLQRHSRTHKSMHVRTHQYVCTHVHTTHTIVSCLYGFVYAFPSSWSVCFCCGLANLIDIFRLISRVTFSKKTSWLG